MVLTVGGKQKKTHRQRENLQTPAQKGSQSGWDLNRGPSGCEEQPCQPYTILPDNEYSSAAALRASHLRLRFHTKQAQVHKHALFSCPKTVPVIQPLSRSLKWLQSVFFPHVQ